MKTLYDVGEGRVFMAAEMLRFPAAPKQAALRERGITMVVNLWHGRDDEIAEVTEYLHAPLSDGKLSDGHLAHLDALATLAARHLGEGGTVLCQCQGGRNRSGLLAGLTLCYWLGISGSDALERVRAGRGAVAVGNHHFARWLASIPASSAAGSVPS